jgi:phosphoglycolate phosphatase-like HAD superfamily hydrolase
MHYDPDRALHIFDCDGVILNSNSLKISALRSALECVNSPSFFIDWAQEEFRLNFGRTRLQHFESFTKCSLAVGYNLSNRSMLRAKNIYSQLVIDLYEKCEVIDRTKEFMLGIPEHHSVFVVSASDQEELRDILPRRLTTISRENIFGGPVSKTENIRQVLATNEGLGAFFYGDAVQDAKAAIHNKITFYGLTAYSAAPEKLIHFCQENRLECFNHCMEVII